MALTNQQLEDRVITIENLLNDIQTALNNLVTSRQMIALTSVRQSEIVDLQERVTTIESEILVIQDAISGLS